MGKIGTTHLGAADNSYIGLYDYIRRPSASDPNPPLNYIEIARTPDIPAITEVSEYSNGFGITWQFDEKVDFYNLYRCTSTLLNTCSKVNISATSSSSDYPIPFQQYYYRLEACNQHGCSAIGAPTLSPIVNLAARIIGVIYLLLE